MSQPTLLKLVSCDGAGAISSVSSLTKELDLIKSEATEGWLLDMTALAVGLWISL